MSECGCIDPLFLNIQVEVFKRKWRGMEQPQDMTTQVETGVARKTLVDIGLASIVAPGSVSRNLCVCVCV